MITYQDLFDRALEEHAVPLSFAGSERRRVMGRALEAAVVSRRQRRRAVQGGAVLALAAAAFWLMLPVASPRLPEIPARIPGYQHLVLVTVHDQAGILERIAVKPALPPSIIWIGDVELIDLLAAADHPSGLLRIAGRLILTDPIVAEEPPD